MPIASARKKAKLSNEQWQKKCEDSSNESRKKFDIQKYASKLPLSINFTIFSKQSLKIIKINPSSAVNNQWCLTFSLSSVEEKENIFSSRESLVSCKPMSVDDFCNFLQFILQLISLSPSRLTSQMTMREFKRAKFKAKNLPTPPPPPVINTTCPETFWK